MDSPEPDTPFAAVSAQTTRAGMAPGQEMDSTLLGRCRRTDGIHVKGHRLRFVVSMQFYQSYLDKSTPYKTYRWIGTGVVFLMFGLRIFFAQGWYIVAYSLGIYLLNLFLAFISPKFDPGLETAEDMEEGSSGDLPTKSTDEFKPFVRRLPEFKFWHAATRAIVIGFFCSWSEIFNLPVFWPVLVVYWLILVVLTMRRQIQHMLKYRYVPWDFGKKNYAAKNSN
ncbi:retrieval of early ER protein Rer1 [Aureobasidium sp. EXF-8845]|nr:retrieval of early ER protein Rer1 [Aureobasidium sp. EXF-8845]KAI4847956.1 retrieval of early ER protein Rer1 [Aureobasidium sp. EXF-8846]